MVLSEDRQHQNFVYSWLRQRGIERGKIRLLPVPAGKGAGEQYVREQYAKQVQTHRRRAGGQDCKLVTIIDADVLPVRQRFEQLEQSLQEAELEGRSPDEMICILVPKRNIETWVHCLVSGPVDEETDYKRPAKSTEEYKDAARRLADPHHLVAAPSGFPPSLQLGWGELKRTF
ncbi:MAG TPA: hypothetical protein VFZ09_50355 [Archangium sp.]|uniref:hypothetical protein n=1 Tax=Archangium sp. TaxID=1872627 RepID=UPI002E34DD00|nr:hypothetical protein [Archangium sp.]HEX5754488.1 hypothetical protein [Archangium sp.]